MFFPDSYNLDYKTSHWECAHTIDIINGLMFIFATQAEFSYMFILGIVNITAFPCSYVLLDLLQLVQSLGNLYYRAIKIILPLCKILLLYTTCCFFAVQAEVATAIHKIFETKSSFHVK